MKLFGTKKAGRSAMSEFIRNASSAEKKKVYRDVIVEATKKQQAVIKRAPMRELTKVCG